jgi:type 1 glutamine amidotransferase
MHTHPLSVFLVALLGACGGCSSNPGMPGGGPGNNNPYSDAGSSAGDATVLADTGVAQPQPPPHDGGALPEASSAPPDASPADAGAPPESGPAGPAFNVLAIGHLVDPDGTDDIHAPYVRAATAWLTTLAAQKNFTFTSVVDPNSITDDFLTPYNLILQLNYTPFGWNTTAQAAFEKYLTEGRGGWVGMHHAALYGPSVQPAGEAPWTWFYNFIGQINFLDYIATFAAAETYIEEPTHPIFAGVPSPFLVTTDEWYKWDQSPRPNVHVLAHVDESSYMPPSDIKMGGDHPVIWTNDAYKGRNVYIFIGHHMNLFQNTAYMQLLENAIFWAAGQPPP